MYLQQKFPLENETQNGNMKKTVYFAALFLYNLALITHNDPCSVNSSLTLSSNGMEWNFIAHSQKWVFQ